MAVELTARKRQILAAVAEHTRTEGYAPSLRDIGAAVGLSSTNAVAYQLRSLVAAGLLAPTLPNQPRTTSLAQAVAVSRNGLVARAFPVTFCPTCGLSLPEDHTCATPTTGLETPVTTFEDIAPYPSHDAEGAADKLARNYTVLAQANFVRSFEGATPEIRHEGTALLLGMYSVVSLLRFLSDFHKDVADDAARELLEDLAAPHFLGPEIYRWLTEYGISPEQVSEIARTLREPSLEKPTAQPIEATA